MADKKQSYQSFFQGAFSIFSPRCQKPGTGHGVSGQIKLKSSIVIVSWPRDLCCHNTFCSGWAHASQRKQRKNKKYSCQLICKVPLPSKILCTVFVTYLETTLYIYYTSSSGRKMCIRRPLIITLFNSFGCLVSTQNPHWHLISYSSHIYLLTDSLNNSQAYLLCCYST